MLPPLSSYRNERDSLASETVPFIKLARVANRGRQVPAYSIWAGTCILTQRIGAWEKITPLQFISMEEI